MTTSASGSLLQFGQHVTKGLGRITEGIMTRGQGSYVEFEDGRRLLDFTCGIGVTGLGEYVLCLFLYGESLHLRVETESQRNSLCFIRKRWWLMVSLHERCLDEWFSLTLHFICRAAGMRSEGIHSTSAFNGKYPSPNRKTLCSFPSFPVSRLLYSNGD